MSSEACDEGTYWSSVQEVCASCSELCRETYVNDVSVVKKCCSSLRTCLSGLPSYAIGHCPNDSKFSNSTSPNNNLSPELLLIIFSLLVIAVVTASVVAVILVMRRYRKKEQQPREDVENNQTTTSETTPLNSLPQTFDEGSSFGLSVADSGVVSPAHSNEQINPSTNERNTLSNHLNAAVTQSENGGTTNNNVSENMREIASPSSRD